MLKSDTLIVAPYVGEFGWEMMNWQARVRWVLRRCRQSRVLLCTPPDRRILYRDLIDQRRIRFCPMPRIAWPGSANDDHRLSDAGLAMNADALANLVRCETTAVLCSLGVDAAECEWLVPEYRSTLWPTTPAHQEFRSLREPGKLEIDVVLVPRSRSTAPERNSPESWWNELADRLRQGGLRVEAMTNRLDRAVSQLSRARLAVGASTGGLHLAALCECPHYVWGSGPEERWTPLEMTNRQRYETVWNPLGTPCRYDECGWRPDVEYVVRSTRRALADIGLRTAATGAPARKSARWRLKRALAAVIEKPSSESIWPWRVRELVRRRLV